MKAKYRNSNGDPKSKKIDSSNPDVASTKKQSKVYRPMTAEEFEREKAAGNLDYLSELTREEEFEMYNQYARDARDETERRKWTSMMDDMLREDYETKKKKELKPITNMTEFLERKREEDLARRNKLYSKS